MKKRLLSIALIGCMVLSLAACGKKEEEPAWDAEFESEEETVDNAVADEADPVGDFYFQEKDGKVRSYLSGEWVDKEVGRTRPLALMIENTKACLPQYGIGNAQIVYECIVESDISRLMGVFDDYSGMEQMGNVRSSRPYYVTFASEYDAIYAHAGGNPAAFERIEMNGVNNLDVNALDGKTKGKNVGYRTGSGGEHCLYTYSDGIEMGIKNKGYDVSFPANYQPHFIFSQEGNALADGETCEGVSLSRFSSKPYYIYNSEDGLYYRYQYGQKHIDAITNEQLAAKNIIIMDVNIWVYPGCEQKDYKGYDLAGFSGTGKFITNGKAIDITWTKGEETDITHYYDMSGNEIQLNIGKTWIEVNHASASNENKIYASASDLK